MWQGKASAGVTVGVVVFTASLLKDRARLLGVWGPGASSGGGHGRIEEGGCRGNCEG